ncbi:hypothetical protein T07_14913 [Trichinella nelsoni]|uniref:Uncharacterized protein n=1 Tax=Trichinella nelsoni TaxID=6336 RepID=A0A0V0RLB3_9BILA|nr:hypothetical protein T07_2715 [Trichinella nelsoni]KRX15262.1 hypothetical protein T07_14913 [Trichinella nelsoni]KRX15263.1 hypothetical protein T07_14913 [Trichinella nelsoni]
MDAVYRIFGNFTSKLCSFTRGKVVIHLHNLLNIHCITFQNNSSIIIRHLDIRHGNTCAELEFLSPISSVIKRYQICKSASPTVS